MRPEWSEQTFRGDEARQWLSWQGYHLINEKWTRIKMEVGSWSEDGVDEEGQAVQLVYQNYAFICRWGLGQFVIAASDIEEIRLATKREYHRLTIITPGASIELRRDPPAFGLWIIPGEEFLVHIGGVGEPSEIVRKDALPREREEL